MDIYFSSLLCRSSKFGSSSPHTELLTYFFAIYCSRGGGGGGEAAPHAAGAPPPPRGRPLTTRDDCSSEALFVLAAAERKHCQKPCMHAVQKPRPWAIECQSQASRGATYMSFHTLRVKSPAVMGLARNQDALTHGRAIYAASRRLYVTRIYARKAHDLSESRYQCHDILAHASTLGPQSPLQFCAGQRGAIFQHVSTRALARNATLYILCKPCLLQDTPAPWPARNHKHHHRTTYTFAYRVARATYIS